MLNCRPSASSGRHEEVTAGFLAHADLVPAVPGHALGARVLIGKRAERVADLPRVTTQAGERGNLPYVATRPLGMRLTPL